MAHRTFLFACPALLALVVASTNAGCMMDDDDTPEASTATGGSSSATGGAGGADAPTPTGLRVQTDNGPAPADLTCLAEHAAPVSAAAVPATLDARAFGMADEMGHPVLVPGLEVQVFADNTIPSGDTCGAGCVTATDNGDGSYSFDAPSAGWIAYRVLERAAGSAGPAALRTMEVNFTAGGEEGLNTIFEPVLDGLHAALQIPRDSEAGLVAGRVLDCNGDFIEGARVFLRDTDGNTIAFDDDTRPIYIDTMGPDPALEATTFAGQWSMTNVPTNVGPIVVEVRAANDVLVGCELAPAAPSAMSVVRITPLRADGPTACAP